MKDQSGTMMTTTTTMTDGTCTELVSQIVTHSGCGAEADRLTNFLDYNNEEPRYVNTTTISTDGAAEVSLSYAPPPIRIAFDTLGMMHITDEMLHDIFNAFDVNGRGGVERAVMRDVMRDGLSNFGAPLTERDIDGIFERATPFRIRRKLRHSSGGVDDDTQLLSFNEFCVLFLGWLRL